MPLRSDVGRISNTFHKEINTAVELKIRGVVQGVGFRPFVHRLANKFGYSGTVTNCQDGVVASFAPPLFHFEQFLRCLSEEAPPLAKITSLEQKSLAGFSCQAGFAIIASSSAGSAKTMIPPDVSVCNDCLTEFLDKTDRRFLYPFINCTNCGPRFSIVESIPYDRPRTSMKIFPMCGACEGEYRDVVDRRFHAQPNACWQCGPHLSWHDKNGRLIHCEDPLAMASQALSQGRVVAIRGLGGFHLAVDGTSEKAVLKLRQRKNRPSKPLAVMVADLESAGEICNISEQEAKVLNSHRRPIVLLPAKNDANLAPSLAPGVFHLGVMLPYTPFHHLLFRGQNAAKILVMTSGNKSNEPICTGNADALARLSGIADFFLFHNRDIVTRVDDSVIRIVAGKERSMRRSRGYVPESVPVAIKLPEIIACGAELKNTFCLARDRDAFVSQHIGDLSTVESLDFYEESIRHLENVLEIKPQALACDLHPDYLSSRYAERLNLPLYRVQHHHAHAVAVMAEHGLQEDTFAIVLDGTGYGPDGKVWGGEILLAGLTSFQRVASLEEMQLPGGDIAAREPWRMAFSALLQAYGSAASQYYDLFPYLHSVAEQKKTMVAQMLASNFNTPLTSSCGRLFDAVAALLGICLQSDYEGQAAMELESVALRHMDGASVEKGLEAGQSLPVLIAKESDRLIIKQSQMIRAIVDSLVRDKERASLALAFHRWLIDSILAAVRELKAHFGKKDVVLGGGCLQNTILLTGLSQKLKEFGFRVYSAEKVPVNDGGLSLGQAVIGGLQHLQAQEWANNSKNL